MIAALHGGALELSCEACAGDPQLKALSGCETPSQEPVWEYEGNNYYSCPLLFIPENVCRWYEEYSYAKELGTNTEYIDRPERWLLGMRIYNSELSKHISERAARVKQESQVKRNS